MTPVWESSARDVVRVRVCASFVLIVALFAVAALLREEVGGRPVLRVVRVPVACPVELVPADSPARCEDPLPHPTPPGRVLRSYDLRAVDAGKVEGLRRWIASDAAVTERATSLEVEASLATHDRIEALLGSASSANVLRSYPADAVALAGDVSRRWPGALLLVNHIGMVVLAPPDVHEALDRRLDGLRFRAALARIDQVSSGGHDRILRYPSEEEWDAPAQRKRQGTP